MRKVDDHADAVHLAHHLAAEAGQAGIDRLVAAGAEQALVVVGELHEPDAELVEHLDQAQVVLDRRTVLEAEDDGGLAGGLGGEDVGGGAGGADEVAVPLETAVPIGDQLQGVAGVLPVGEGDMDGGEAAGAQLLEQGAVPVAVLQPVDDDEAVVEVADHAAHASGRSG